MDTSEAYVKMCDCGEVQGQCGYRQGFYAIDDRIAKPYLISNDGKSGSHFGSLQWAGIVNAEKSIYFFLANYPPLKYISEEEWREFIWFPTQDQIQEMMPQKLPGNLGIVDTKTEWWQDDKRMIVFNLINEFRHFWEEKRGYLRKMAYEKPASFSMEQVWLAFYMHEKHGKTWNGEKWV